ncbi:MAG: ABC transporter permease [Roseibium sp.]|uniref:ABC transporter permease n=1 Tax=Roseibium sp. TaxID=1936156 RepID=UPI0026375D7C|nr:ABC transporter permease [Roseibium sp.]MCV0426026.1 ABC transporter permease [Roseibium sp.]
MKASPDSSDGAVGTLTGMGVQPAGFHFRFSELQLRLLSIVVFFAAWQIAGLVPISPAFPTFSATMVAMFDMTLDGSLLAAYVETLKPLVLGVGISAVFGVAIGVSMGLYKSSRWLWEPIFVVLQASPVAALIPLITYAYGIGLTAKTVAVIILASPIIVLNTYKAVGNASPVLIQMCRSFQGTRLQEIWKVIIPNAAPVIFAGLRLGVAAGFIGVILAELLITPTGVGDIISYNRSIANYPAMYAAVLSIIVFSAVMVSLLEKAEVRYFRPEKKRGH